MNTNKELFYKRCRKYFEENADSFIESLNKEASSAFFINEKKASKEDIFSIIDFDYKESNLNPKSYYTNVNNIGKTKAYELGLIYPQDVESSLPASFVDTSETKLIIDLCAAPGGKSINILNKLSNDSLLIANDISYKRATALVSNLERLGFGNVMITSLEPSYLADEFDSCFDLVILDAPCSGEGMIRKYPEILDTYSLENINNLANIQSKLLDNAYKLLKKGGQILYSTCTYAFEEDEDQIINFLKKYNDLELIKINAKYNYSKLDGCVKLCPLNNTEGQFMCLIKKNDGYINKPKFKKTCSNEIVEKFIKENLIIDKYYLYNNKQYYYISFNELINIKDHILNQGIFLGELKKDRFEPSHSLYRTNSMKDLFKYTYELDDGEYEKFIKGQEIKASLTDNYYLLKYKNLSLGYGKCSKGIIKNKYPKGLRR